MREISGPTEELLDAEELRSVGLSVVLIAVGQF
jgi:hypothetical protein